MSCRVKACAMYTVQSFCCHSKSFKIIHICTIEWGVSSYYILPMALLCIVPEIKRDVGRNSWFLPRDAMQAWPMSSCGVCPSVCHVRVLCQMNKHIKIFSPSGSHAILVFRAKRHSNIPTGTPIMGVSNSGGVGRNRDSELISGLTACVTAAIG